MSLEQLKTIRKQRMERTYIELQVSKDKLNVCENDVHQAKLKFDEFHHWRLEHQETLFSRLQSASFSSDDLQRYMTKLEGLKEEEEALKAEVPRLEKKAEVARAALSQLRVKLVNISRDLEKAKEFIEMEKEAIRLEENKKEDEIVDELASFGAIKR